MKTKEFIKILFLVLSCYAIFRYILSSIAYAVSAGIHCFACNNLIVGIYLKLFIPILLFTLALISLNLSEVFRGYSAKSKRNNLISLVVFIIVICTLIVLQFDFVSWKKWCVTDGPSKDKFLEAIIVGIVILMNFIILLMNRMIYAVRKTNPEPLP